MNEELPGKTISLSQLLGACFLFILLCVTGGALLAATAIPVAAVSGTTTNALTGLFEDLPTDIDFTQPSQQSVITDSEGNTLARFYTENRIVVGSDQISQHLKDAVVAIEDQRFFEHNGVDPQGIIRAALNNFTGGNLAGGSTITQQYVKNALIEEGRIEDSEEKIAAATQTSLARKLNEARYAVAIENAKTKDEILTSYLNIAQFGPSQWGVESAARYFFGVSAKDVTISQAAMLAGDTQAPNKWNPEENPEGTQQRRDAVLDKMLSLGYITQEEHDEAQAINVADMLHITPSSNGCASAGNAAYFCSTVVEDLLNTDILGKNKSDRVTALYRGGLTITSTLVKKNQDAAAQAISERIDINDSSQAQMALASLEPGTGKVVAMAQNTNYGDPTPEDPTRTVINLSVGEDQGGGGGFQSGSTYKLFTLTEWIKEGHTINERVNNGPRTFPADSWKNSCYSDQVSTFAPQNSGGGGSGSVTVRTATAQSYNVAFTEMANKLDLCGIWKTANDLGIRRGGITTEKDIQENAYIKATGVKAGDPLPLESLPSTILGTNPVTPLSMANAYATIAADGKRCEPITFTTVKDAQGKTLGTQKSTCTQALDSEVARQVTVALQGVSDARLAGRPAAGKTGTTDDNVDVWFAGYTPQLSTAVWLGHANGLKSLNGTAFKGVYYGSVYGATIPAPVCRSYMQAALEGVPPQAFPQPKKILVQEPEEKEEEDSEHKVANVVGMDYDSAVATLHGQGYNVTIDVIQDGGNQCTQMSPAAGTKLEPGATIHLVCHKPQDNSSSEQAPPEANNTDEE